MWNTWRFEQFEGIIYYKKGKGVTFIQSNLPICSLVSVFKQCSVYWQSVILSKLVPACHNQP